MNLIKLQENTKKGYQQKIKEDFENYVEKNAKKFSEEELEELEGFIVSLRNWITNFEWDGHLRKFTDK